MHVFTFFTKGFVFVLCFSLLNFYIFRKQPAHPNTVSKFFQDFYIGGHRGSPIKQPENTIASMEQAKLEGASLIEFDIALTKDNVAIVLHDDTLDRTTDKSGYIGDCLYKDLQHCNAAAKFQTQDENRGILSIPTLDEIVAWAHKNQIKMIFDVKDSNQYLINQLSTLFEKYNLYEMGMIASFYPNIIYRIKQHNSHIITGLTWKGWFWTRRYCKGKLFAYRSSMLHALVKIFDICYMWSVKNWLADFLGADVLLTERQEISEMFIRNQRKQGRKVCAWVVNDLSDMIWLNKSLHIPFLTDKPFLAQHLNVAS